VAAVPALGFAQTATVQLSPITISTAGTAAAVAPATTPLDAGQPTSVVGTNYIANETTPSESYDQLITITPSVEDLQPSGPVAQQNFGESIRGFQYTQFNTTLDGIVLAGTTSTFAPQTATYITDHDIGQVSVDRGPGTAATIGYATFGGTVALTSKTPDAVTTFNPYVSLGSFRSNLYGLDAETGVQPGGGSGFIDVSDTATGAALSGVTTERKNVFLKWVQPLGANTTLTAGAIINRSYGHTPYGAELSQITKYGDGYALSSNPGSQAFYGDNTDSYDTDFEYLRIASQLTPALALTDTLYTQAYDHNGYQGADPNGTTPNLNGTIYINGKPVDVTNNVPGLSGHNDFRDDGDVLAVSETTGFGSVQAGFWYDYSSNSAYKDTSDLTAGNIPYATTATGSVYTYLYEDTLTTLQPYAQADIDLAPPLTLILGSKFTSITRSLDAIVNKSTLKPADDHETFQDFEPSAELKYKLTPDWSAYVQTAKGFLAPPLSVFATTDVTAVTPETTVNYQAGTSVALPGLTASFDGYYIPFQNYLSSAKVAGVTLYSNQGGAVFKGLESEFTKTLAFDVSLYANGSLNDATYDNGATVAQAPRRTGAAGLLYDHTGLAQPHDHLTATLLSKYVGPQYGQDSKKVDSFPIKSFDDTTASLSYAFHTSPKREFEFAVNLDNLLDRHGIIGFAGTAGDGVTPLYYTEAGRSVFFTLSAKLE